MKKAASAEQVLDFSVAVIELYFRIEAASAAAGGFAQAGGEWGVMRSLVLEGPQTVPAIAASRPVSRQHCQTIVNSLKARGFVELAPNPRHKRSMLVRATKKGRSHFEALTQTFLAAAARFAPSFERAEVEAATDLLRRARAVLSPPARA